MTPLAQKVLARAISKGENTLIGLSVHYTKMLPVIRELLELVKSQREALVGFQGTHEMTAVALTHTDEVLKRLGDE